mmetsp:Transcript_43231/g.140208  ORF Transcript_43231/g.140208 Transcript_43231/m.140208 type:complete len:137 (+) Transcript_43231:134-544(+)
MAVLKTVGVGVFAILAFYLTWWMCVTLATSSLLYLTSLDATPLSAAIWGGAVLLLAAVLYYIFYPEGQKLRSDVLKAPGSKAPPAAARERPPAWQTARERAKLEVIGAGGAVPADAVALTDWSERDAPGAVLRYKG